MPVRDHPFPLLTADTLHRNGALSEQDEPFYEPKSALLFLLGQDSMEGALFEEGCQCVVPQGSLAAPNGAKLSLPSVAQMAPPWSEEAGFGGPTFWGSAPRALPGDFWEAGAAY